MKNNFLLLALIMFIVLLTACNGAERDVSDLTADISTAVPSETQKEQSTETLDESTPDAAGSTESTAENPDNSKTPDQSGSPAGNSSAGSGSQTSSPPSNNSASGGNTSRPPVTSTPSDPPVTSEPPTSKPTEPPKPSYTEGDYKYIVKTVRQYAEGKTTMKFDFDETIEMDARFHGWHGTPSLSQKGIDGVISTLKYHADLTEQLILGQVGNDYVTITYNIIWYTENGAIYFVLIY